MMKCRGASAVAHCLGDIRQLRMLDMRNNSIGALGFDKLSESRFPPRLELLDLRANAIHSGHSSADRLLDAWRKAGKPPSGLLIGSFSEICRQKASQRNLGKLEHSEASLTNPR